MLQILLTIYIEYFLKIWENENSRFHTPRKQFFFNQRNIFLIYGQRKNVFELKNVTSLSLFGNCQNYFQIIS